MADLPAAQAAAVAEACAQEAGVFTLEAAQEEALWTDALAQAGLLVDVPAEAVREAEEAAGDPRCADMAGDGPSGIVVDAYRNMWRDHGVYGRKPHRFRNVYLAKNLLV